MGTGNLGIALKGRRATSFNWHRGYVPVGFDTLASRRCFPGGGVIVRGTPLCHAFPSRTLLLLPTGLPPSNVSSAFQCIFCLQMCPPPSDVSSAPRCVFCFATRLPPPDLSPAPPPTMVPSSACRLTASPGCWDFHRHPATFCNVSPGPLSIPLGIRRTATPSAVPLMHLRCCRC